MHHARASPRLLNAACNDLAHACMLPTHRIRWGITMTAASPCNLPWWVTRAQCTALHILRQSQHTATLIWTA